MHQNSKPETDEIEWRHVEQMAKVADMIFKPTTKQPRIDHEERQRSSIVGVEPGDSDE